MKTPNLHTLLAAVAAAAGLMLALALFRHDPLPLRLTDENALSRLEACLAIWRDETYLQALREEGVVPLLPAKDICLEIMAADPVADFETGSLLLVADFESYARFGEMTDTQLAQLGFFPERKPWPFVEPVSLSTPGSLAPVPDKPACICRWVGAAFVTAPALAVPPGQRRLSGTQWLPLAEAQRNDCFGTEAGETEHAVRMMLMAKVECRPHGCCQPMGATKSISAYRSRLAVDSGRAFCGFLPTGGRALAADSVDFRSDGNTVAGGSGHTLLTSGTARSGGIDLAVGGLGAAADEPPGGAGRQWLMPTRVKRTGPHQASLIRLGNVANKVPTQSAELHIGRRTQVTAKRRSAALAEQATLISGLGMYGAEHACGAGQFEFYRYRTSPDPRGQAAGASFERRFKLLKTRSLP